MRMEENLPTDIYLLVRMTSDTTEQPLRISSEQNSRIDSDVNTFRV